MTHEQNQAYHLVFVQTTKRMGHYLNNSRKSKERTLCRDTWKLYKIQTSESVNMI